MARLAGNVWLQVLALRHLVTYMQRVPFGDVLVVPIGACKLQVVHQR